VPLRLTNPFFLRQSGVTAGLISLYHQEESETVMIPCCCLSIAVIADSISYIIPGSTDFQIIR
jgi:hypothetical protein